MTFGGFIHEAPRQWIVAGALLATTTAITVPVRMEMGNTTAYSISEQPTELNKVRATSDLIDVALRAVPARRHMADWERKLTTDFLISLCT